MDALFVAVNAKYVHTNIAVRYLKRICENQGFDCDFAEFTINEPQNIILQKLYMQDAAVYGFSCYIWNIGTVLELCRNLKKLKPVCKIVLGGPEVSFDAEEILKNNDFVDFVFSGEGEALWADFLSDIPKPGQVIGGKRVEDLDKLPFPYSDDDLRNVVVGEKLVYYETSRGCPFGCAYCLSSTTDGVRFLSLERVKNELKKFAELGVMTVKFVDRTFNADKKRALEIWKYCLTLSGDTCFHFEIGADLITDEAIEGLKAAPKGKFQFEIGVQTTNEKVISEISRTMDFEVLKRNVKAVKENTQIMLHLDLIAGLPFEDFESFKKSFDDVYALNPHVLQLGFLKLLKGSRLREDASKYGMMFSDVAPYEIFSNRWISYSEIIKLKGVEDVLERYMNSGRFPRTLKCLESIVGSTFEFYEKLSNFFDNRGLIGQGVKRISLYQLLYEFLKEELPDENLSKVMGEMKKDFAAWHSNGVGTPEWYKRY